MPIISALQKLRQEDHEMEVDLKYMSRPESSQQREASLDYKQQNLGSRVATELVLELLPTYTNTQLPAEGKI